MEESRRVQKILVPVDFSKQSQAALDEGRRLAGLLHAQLVLLHVIEVDLVFEGPTIPIEWRIDQKIEERVTQLRRMAGLDMHPDMPMDAVCLARPRAAKAIVEYASDIGADLIVMGTHKRRGFAHLVLGSVAESVLRHTACPVLIVGPPAEEPAKAA